MRGLVLFAILATVQGFAFTRLSAASSSLCAVDDKVMFDKAFAKPPSLIAAIGAG